MEKVVLAYGDSNTHGTKPMATLEDIGRFPANGRQRILVVAPMPVEEVGCLAEMFAGGAAKSRGVAEAYAGVAALHGTDFLDGGTVIAVSPVDGIHFDAPAHAALGAAIAAKIKEMDLRP